MNFVLRSAICFSFLLVFVQSDLNGASFAQSENEQKEKSQKADKVDPKLKQLLQSAKKGEHEKVEQLLKAGADVNGKTDYGVTALHFAAARGHLKVVEVLLANGADPVPQDNFYKASPLDWAMTESFEDVGVALVKTGKVDLTKAFNMALDGEMKKLIKVIIESEKADEELLRLAKSKSEKVKDDELKKMLADIEVAEPKDAFKMDLDRAKKYAGSFSREDSEIKFELKDKKLFLFAGPQEIELEAVEKDEFRFSSVKIKFVEKDGKFDIFVMSSGGNDSTFLRVDSKSKSTPKDEPKPDDNSKPKFAASSAESKAADLKISSNNWPQFRGNGSRGVADGQSPPVHWNFESEEKSTNLKWRKPVEGLGHSCPVIWEDRIFITTAVSKSGNEEIKIGQYGDVDSVEDDAEYEYKVICLAKETGSLLWKKTATEGVPKVKRHLKSTHANSTIATNGKFVIAFFASEGLYCYTNDGELLWKRDLGLLNSGWFYDADFEWGFGSSPVIHRDRAIVQCDIQDESFLLAIDLKSGKDIWRVERDEIPTWSSPTVMTFDDETMIVTNGTKFVRANDFETGKEIWRLNRNSEIAVPTPFKAHNMIFVSSGYRPIQPIYAILPTAKGDISLKDSEESTSAIAWSKKRGGPYMPTPICYGDYIYCCGNGGIITCYEAKTGKRVYRKRLQGSGTLSFVGSPIAADGHLYITAEDGETFVVKAGPEFELVGSNKIGENVLTTAAISDKVFYVRSQHHLFAFSGNEKPKPMSEPKSDENEEAAFPEFETKVIDPQIGKVCYAVTVADVDGDEKLDVVSVSEKGVYWYENPSWNRRTIIENQTDLDNVCIAAHDIDGDGKVDFALGAGWTKIGTIQWLSRGKTLDEKWTVHPIAKEAWTHRMRFADVLGKEKSQLVVSPLNKTVGNGVRLTAFEIPADPQKDRWIPHILNAEMNRMHNHWHLNSRLANRTVSSDDTTNTLTASQEGIHLITKTKDGFDATQLTKSAAGEVKTGTLDGKTCFATIEPMHGTHAVLYTSQDPSKADSSKAESKWKRTVLTDQLKQGHAVWLVDLNNDQQDEIIIGHREKASGEKPGPALYAFHRSNGTWNQHTIDSNIAVEDALAADLNADGKPDLIAGGRSTHNVKIYFSK